MKKAILATLAVLLVAVLGFGGALLLAWNSAGTDTVPTVSAVAFGQPLSPVTYQWNQPVLGGLFYRSHQPPSDGYTETLPLVQLTDTGGDDPFRFPEGYDAELELYFGETLQYGGPASGWEEALIAEPGFYRLRIACTRPKQEGKGYGVFHFELSLEVPQPPEPVPEPIFVPGTTQLAQGDIFSMQLLNLPAEAAPTAETELGMAVFTPTGEEGCWFAAVPIGNNREPGDYTISITAGELYWQITVTVVPFEFDFQNLIIDLTDPDISEANSPAAYQQYRDKMYPLFESYDTQRYWEGLFIVPVAGDISTHFGEIRITNGDWSTSRSHNGMDIKAAQGTPVQVPNHGRVVLAEYLLNTGWTVVIEHGGGLKSYYFHMHEISVEAGQMVEKGQLMGQVGTTGYSTGPHLHFETRIGSQPISPEMLFLETAGLYSTDS